jgi:hypothetical protein
VAWADDLGLGTGRNGNLNIGPGETRIINSYATLESFTADAGTNASSLTIKDIRPTPASADDGFHRDDLILVFQTTTSRNAQELERRTPPFALESSEGVYEFARLKEVSSGPNPVITTVTALVNSYDPSATQVIRVPEYVNLTLNGGIIRPAQWDGTSGGLIAFLATGTVRNDGSISATAMGFRAGLATSADVGIGCSGSNEPDGGQKGEGMVSRSFANPTSGYGRGNLANGAGGGVCLASGGAGGGHGGEGGMGGRSNDDARNVGGIGGAALSYEMSEPPRLTFGGGGGSGVGNFGTGGPVSNGGAGGGAVVLRACNFIGTGTLAADGDPGLGFGSGNVVSAGGGGAGGAIVVRLAGDAGVRCSQLSVKGGNGGNIGGQTPPVGPGGGGGAGRIFVQAANVSGCPLVAFGGDAGVLQDMRSFGATPGGGVLPDSGTIQLQALPFDPGDAGCRFDPPGAALVPHFSVGCGCTSSPGLMVFAAAAVVATMALRPTRRERSLNWRKRQKGKPLPSP